MTSRDYKSIRNQKSTGALGAKKLSQSVLSGRPQDPSKTMGHKFYQPSSHSQVQFKPILKQLGRHEKY